MAARQRKTVARRVGLDKVQSERVVSSTGQCDFHFQLCHLTCLALRKTMSPGGHKHSPQPNHNGTCAGQSKASGQHPGSWLGSRIPGTDYPSKPGGGKLQKVAAECQPALERLNLLRIRPVVRQINALQRHERR